LNFSGHGGEIVPDSPFSIKQFACDVVNYLDDMKLEAIDIFGYSMGGYVGVYLARYYPQRIGSVFTIGTKFKWNEEISAREVKMLDVIKMKEKIPLFYEELAKRHAPQDIEIILKKSADMMINLGKKNELNEADYGKITSKVMIAVGDKDKMVSLEETIDVYNRLREGRLLVLPGTPHPFEQINLERMVWEIKNFF
jgi:pimeloyl-ACP methyl ester carboxylesterase